MHCALPVHACMHRVAPTLWISTKLTRMAKSLSCDASTRLKMALITSGITPRDLPPGLYSLPIVYVCVAARTAHAWGGAGVSGPCPSRGSIRGHGLGAWGRPCRAPHQGGGQVPRSWQEKRWRIYMCMHACAVYLPPHTTERAMLWTRAQLLTPPLMPHLAAARLAISEDCRVVPFEQAVDQRRHTLRVQLI